MQYIERFMDMAHEVIGMEDSILVVKKSGQSCSHGLYRIEGNITKSDNEALTAHPGYNELVWGGI